MPGTPITSLTRRPVARPPGRRPAVVPAGRAPHVPGLSDPPEFFRLDDMEVFAVGQHRPDEGVWTADDLRKMVENFDLHAKQTRGRVYPNAAVLPIGDPDLPDLGIDHDQVQRLLAEVGAASGGRVEAMRFLEDSGVVVADVGRVLKPVAEAVRAGKLAGTSGEIYRKNPPGTPDTDGPVFMRVSLLGHALPAVKTIDGPPMPTPDYRTYSEAGLVAAPRRPSRPVHVYAEGRSMANKPTGGDNPFRQAWIDGLAGIPVTMTADQLAALPDDQLLALATAEEAGEGEGGDGAAGRAAAEAELAAADPTMTADQIKAMDDPTFWAAYTAKTGRPAPSGGATTMQYTEQARRGGVPLNPEAFAKQVSQIVLADVRGELQKTVIDPALASVTKQADQVRAYSEQQARKAFMDSVDLWWKNLEAEGLTTPGDTDTAGGKVIPLPQEVKNLYGLPAVSHNYSEGGQPVSETPAQAMMRRIEGQLRERPRRYGEGIPQDRHPPNGAAPTPERLTQLLNLTAAGRAALALRNGNNN